MRRMILTGSLALALCSTAMAGQIYKWQDAQGQVHFGSQPPEGVQASVVSSYGAPSKPAPSKTPATAPEPTASDASQEEIDAKVKRDVAAEEVKLKQYCSDLRTNLAQLENNPRVRVEENGETRRLSEEERQARISEAQKAIKENCQ